MREVLALLDGVAHRTTAAQAPREGLVERLAMYRQLADQRVAALQDRWASAAGFAEALHRHEQRLRRIKETHS